ncbi:MAG TPA: hypothetical protein PL183_07620 [Aquamicrobium sp.]|nr:hypothetical protein [Aquamicrobium sp.]
MHDPAVGTPAFHHPWHPWRAARRALASASPLAAAALLTAAAFLLPAPGTGHQARAFAGHFESFNVPPAFR